jgi:peroxiredoxin
VPQNLSIGDRAPNFDLTSTEDVVLMLRDEVARMAVLLYFFADPSTERVRRDLETLGRTMARLREHRAVILGVSGSELPLLKETQKALALGFPLLHDDRGFAAGYGLEAEEGTSTESALFLVDRNQRILWLARPVSDLSEALTRVESVLQKQPSPTHHYPGTVINRVVDWWVNKIRRPRVA